MKNLFVSILLFSLLASCGTSIEEHHDIVINNRRVIDPESKTDKILNVGIKDGSIITITESKLKGKTIIDATDYVVSPGFIDLHTHTPTSLGTHFQLKDGVTTALELEAGAFPVAKYGGLIKDAAVNNFGASVGYISIRTKVLEGREIIALVSEAGSPKPGEAFIRNATPEEIGGIRVALHEGLDQGGIGIGLALDYISMAVDDAELRMIFEVAADRSAPIWVHLRRGVQGDMAGLEEFIAMSKELKVAIHICHINANAMGKVSEWIDRITVANTEGADITIEMYPYTAGSAHISSAVFNRDWRNIFGIEYEDVQWSETGKYLNKETFEKYKKEEPTGMVIHHYQKEEWIRKAIQSPHMLIASDAMPLFRLSSKVVPNGIGTFSRVLAAYVRDLELISLNDAIAKMSYLPAKRLGGIAPIFQKKGRVSVGADADLVLFKPETVQNHSTYENPFVSSTGMDYVIVDGQIVIDQGKIVNDTYPGRHVFGKIKDEK